MLIVFDGINGTGKSTIIDRIRLRLSSVGCSTFVVPRSKWYLPNIASYKGLEQLFLLMADRSVAVAAIKENQHKADFILCDRFTASTVAYQGYGHRLDLELIHTLNAASTQGLKPDLTIWLDMPADKAVARAKGDRLDSYDVAFYKRVREGYAAHFASSGENVVRVWADQSVEEVEERIWAVVGGMLPRVEKA